MSSWLKRWKYCPKKKMTFIQVQPDFLWFKSVICLSLYFPLFCICHLCILITVKFTKDIMDGFFNSIEAIVRDLTDLKRKNMKYWKSHKNLKNSVSIYLMLVEAYFQACLAGVWVDFPCFELVSIVDVSQKWCLAQAEKCNPSTFIQNLPGHLVLHKIALLHSVWKSQKSLI